MKTFRVYKTEQNVLSFIQEGWSFWAFVFNVLWLIFMRLWLHGAAFFVILSILGFLHQDGKISAEVLMLCNLLINIYISLNARDYLAVKLEKSGYKLVDIVIAHDLEEAEFRYLDKVSYGFNTR
jgi:hypothetical protein